MRVIRWWMPAVMPVAMVLAAWCTVVSAEGYYAGGESGRWALKRSLRISANLLKSSGLTK